MAMDKAFRRIEAKIDALLKERGIHARDIDWGPETPARAPRELTAAEQQAIDNAPKPTPVAGPPRGPRVTAQNAPDTSSSVPVVPADAVGTVTIETTQPDGKTTVDTMPASEAKRK
jgi:hypothetical protein